MALFNVVSSLKMHSAFSRWVFHHSNYRLCPHPLLNSVHICLSVFVSFHHILLPQLSVCGNLNNALMQTQHWPGDCAGLSTQAASILFLGFVSSVIFLPFLVLINCCVPVFLMLTLSYSWERVIMTELMGACYHIER